MAGSTYGGSGPPEAIVDLLPVILVQQGGLGEQHLCDLVLSNRFLYAVPLEKGMSGKDIATGGILNWAAPGLGTVVLRKEMAKRLLETLPERWALYSQGHTERLARGSPVGLVIGWDQVKRIRLTGVGAKYVEFVLPDRTYYFHALAGQTQEVFSRVSTVFSRLASSK